MRGIAELGKGLEAADSRRRHVLVSFADVPEALTFGADEDGALPCAADAVETALSFYIEAPKPVIGKLIAGVLSSNRPRRWRRRRNGFDSGITASILGSPGAFGSASRRMQGWGKCRTNS